MDAFTDKLFSGKITEEEILNTSLISFMDKEVLEKAFGHFFFYSHGNSEYLYRFNKIYFDALTRIPTIGMFDEIFSFLAANEWKKHRKINNYLYDNVSLKIIAQLDHSKTFAEAKKGLDVIYEIERNLGNKYIDLVNNMQLYIGINNSDAIDKEERLNVIKDSIAKLCSIYISRSRELYEKRVIDEYRDNLRKFFIIKLNNPLVKKKVYLKYQREKYCELYQKNNQEVISFINDLINEYSSEIDQKKIIVMIDNIIKYSCFKLGDIYPDISSYLDEYEYYKEAKKLVNRLNSKYINYYDKEVFLYRDVIGYDKDNRTFFYKGKKYKESDEKKYLEYKKCHYIFEKIKRKINDKIQELDVIVDDKTKKSEVNSLPFNDTYYVFDDNLLINNSFTILKNACLSKIILNYDNLKDNDSYNIIYDLLVNKGLFWLLVFNNFIKQNTLYWRSNIDYDEFLNMIEVMNKNIILAKSLNLNIHDLNNLSFLTKINEQIDSSTIAILGRDTISKLFDYKSFTEKNGKDIIAMAKRLYLKMIRRTSSTVPFINNKCGNYMYEMYDYITPDILLSGYNTNACFTVNGNDNDFLHYCALDKNGFVIKITDNKGKFIARASGFRNGNCVFINQLRTIYDRIQNECHVENKNELCEIINTFKEACMDIIRLSEGKEKIEYVFVTKSFALKSISSNVSKNISKLLNKTPIDLHSSDWYDFIVNAPDLEESDEDSLFMTDYGTYPLICIAKDNPDEILKPSDLKFYDAKEIYHRKRNKPEVINEINSDISERINRIEAIDCIVNNRVFEGILVSKKMFAIIGDNWYILCDDDYNIIRKCALDFDKYAINEMELVKNLILKKEKTLIKK